MSEIKKIGGTQSLIKMVNFSVTKGESIRFQIPKFELGTHEKIRLTISKINADDTIWACGGSADFNPDGEVTFSTNPLETGFYRIDKIQVFNEIQNSENDQLNSIIPNPIALFEIRNPDEKEHSQTELQTKFIDIEKKRKDEFLSGFGDSHSSPGIHEYRGFVFIKNCLITQKIRIGNYEIFGIGELPFTDEQSIVDIFINNFYFPPFKLNWNPMPGEPVIVVHFPRIFARSSEEASELIRHESNILSNLLSLQRQSYGTIICILMHDIENERVDAKLHAPNYRGNLVGGLISGEYPPEIRKRLKKVRDNPRLQLYLSLYTDTLRAEDNNFKYFRFWNLLETIARSKNYIGRSLYDIQGNPILNKKGKPRIVPDHAVELVTELLKDVYKSQGMKDSFIDAVIRRDELNIWYRHRNCIVHYGGCFPDNPNNCKRDDPVSIKCKQAQDLYKKQGGAFDSILQNLKTTVELIIKTELD